ncbi:hypothetical protein GCM10027592_11200 [Spirosoma flavus]
MGTAYTQNFSSVFNFPGSIHNSLSTPGWYLTESGGGGRDNEYYAVGTGSDNIADMYCFISPVVYEQALGSIRSADLIPVFGAAFTNNTGATIQSLAISYTGEQWRLGTEGRTDRLNFEYSTDATSLTTGNWAPITDLDFLTPTTTGVGAKDGNNGANRIALSTTIGSQSIPNGATFWIRWVDEDATGDDDGLAVDDFSLTPQGVATPNLTINDVSLSEGNAGTTTYTFTVSLSAPAGPGGVTFDIATADGTATAPGDYTAKSLTGQTIPAGSSTYTFSVLVNGDTSPETNETFFVNVTNVTGANVTDGQGQGTIVNDDAAPNLSINDVSLSEGNAGTTTFNFTVSLSAPAPAGGVTFNYATADGTATATAPGDYIATSGSVTIPAGVSTSTISVQVNGDITLEPDETFFVNLTNITNAVGVKIQGVGTIVNDDAAPNLTINDVTLNEGNAGTTTFTFTVSLFAPAPAGGVTFNIATANGTATVPVDYSGKQFILQTIPAGSSTYTFDVTVNGDVVVEPTETFFVNVTNITNAIGIDTQGRGTIVNDDVAPPTFATIAGNSSICSGQSTTLAVTVTNGTSPYSLTISDGSSTQEISGYVSGSPITVTPSQSTTYTIAALTDAGSSSASPANLSGAAEVTINAVNATLSPSESQLTCSEPVLSLTATGGVSYTLTDGASNTINTTGIFPVSNPGEYTVTVANASGCTATATTYVDGDFSGPDNPRLEVEEGMKLSCANPSVNIIAYPYEQIKYEFSEGATQSGGPASNIASVTQVGTYSVIITGYNGCTASASVTVEYEDASPTISISPASATLTCANPSVMLEVQSEGEGAYLWNTGETSPFISATAAGTYSVTMTIGNGCSSTATAQVFQDNSGSSVSITPSSATLTCSTTAVSLNAVGSGTYLWNTGATTSAISVTAAGVYSVTLTGTGNCTSTASVEVFQNNAAPTVTVTPTSATLSCTTPAVTLNAQGSAGTYRWNTGATTSSISATAAGSYSVTLTGTNGCTAMTSAAVSQDNSTPLVTITPSSATLTCANPTVTLTASGTGTYQWNTGASSQAISVSLVGTYSVTVTGSNGCIASATATVSQDNSSPIVSISPISATLTCANPTATLVANGSGTYLWNTGATTSSISATAAGLYSVTLTGTNGCTAMTSATVSQDNSTPSVTISPSSATLTCANPTVTLTANGTGTYLWSTGATTSSITVNTANTYSVTLTAANGCKASNSAQVSQDNSMPSVSINPSSSTLSCTNPSVTLNAVGNGTFVWNTGATTPSISATAAGTYSVTLTGNNGCKAIALAQVSQDNTMPQVSISANPSLTIASGQSTTLTATGATTYQWSTGANTTSIVVNTAGPYSVTGTTGNCTAQASVTVIQNNPPAGPFAITAVTTNTCQQISSNRYVVSFTPYFSGLNGQPVSVSVVNEMFPTTAPGPYTLQLYDDNPIVVFKAQQTGTPGEASFTYNWLEHCQNPVPNTPPRVNQPLSDQVARVGQEFGYTIPQNTFTDNESPHSLVLTVSGLPEGLNFSPPVQIGGVPAVAGVRSVTVTATDPQGLSVSTNFLITVVESGATNTPPTVVNPIASQVAIQGQPYGLNVGNTFTDAQTPNSLTLSVSGQPAGINLVGSTLSGTPSQTGTSTITLTATDPGGLSTSTSFALTVQPASATSSAAFAITAVNPLTCTQISHNRYEISFMPVYSGLNGQPVSFSVVNEMFPTTAPGPYSLQLYNDNPTIILKAIQGGSAGEASYTYNWLANCRAPQPNTPPRVNIPLTNQTAKVGQEFGYTIPQTTFTDNESPHTLVLTVSGLPAGLNFSPPVQIGGVPSVAGVSSVTVTATDPQGLSVSTTFVLTVLPAGSPNPETFSITGVQTLTCTTINAGLRSVTFQPLYGNVNGQPITFSVVNEKLPTTDPGPYTLQLYTDNPTILLKATQQGTPGETSYTYNWLAACSTPTGRQGVGERMSLDVVVLGNPVTEDYLEIEIRNGQSQSVRLNVVNEQGRSVSEANNLLKTNNERLRLPLKGDPGIYLLQVASPAHQQTIKILKQ